MRMFGQHVVKPQTRHTAFEREKAHSLSFHVCPSTSRSSPRAQTRLARVQTLPALVRAVLGGVEAMGLLEEAVDQHQSGHRAQSAQRRPEQHRGDGLRVQKEGERR